MAEHEQIVSCCSVTNDNHVYLGKLEFGTDVVNSLVVSVLGSFGRFTGLLSLCAGLLTKNPTDNDDDDDDDDMREAV